MNAMTALEKLQATVANDIQLNNQIKDIIAIIKEEKAVNAYYSLTHSEAVAMYSVLSGDTPAHNKDLHLVVASKVADTCGVARSVVVSALCKLAAAGIVTTQSLGMKGTLIRERDTDSIAILLTMLKKHVDIVA